MQVRAPERFPIGVSRQLSIGRQPDEKEIADLAARGFHSIVNLRGAHELNQRLSPTDEGLLVEKAGMTYVHHPLTVADLGERTVDQFVEMLEAVKKPALLHCENGLRAVLLGLTFVACDDRQSGDWVIERAEALGFDVRAPLVRTFLRAYVDRAVRHIGCKNSRYQTRLIEEERQP
jgi:uncharacterized protein (TIGR01244 family)